MELEEAMKEMKIEIEKFENDLKALEKTDIDAEYKIQIVNELMEYILVRQTILTHITKQENIIKLMVNWINMNEDPFEGCHENGKCEDELIPCGECIKQYFEKKAEEEI